MWNNLSTYLPVEDPTWNFLVVLALILFAPMLLERLRVPSIVGLIFAGVLVGPHGLHILERDDSFELFGKVGLYYIMFLASLEMNLQDVRKDKQAALGYGLLSFIIPFVMGVAVNVGVLKVSLIAAILIASMYAAHTLLSYPIVMRFGLSQRRSVNLAVGGTIVADTLTLLVLAVVGGLFREGGVTPIWWLGLLLKIVAMCTAIIVVFPRVCRWFFRHYDDGVVQYIFVLGLVFLGAGLMDLIGMEGILGAFLVGLVLNRTIPTSSPLMSHIEFVGNALFIPYFLIGVGMIINLGALVQGFGGIGVAIVMTATATLGKWLAARAGQSIFHLTKDDRLLLFGLSNARAAATLAIMLVGSRILLPDGSSLFGTDVVNGTMLLILMSCITSSMATDRAARRLMLSSAAETGKPQQTRLLVGIGDPDHAAPLMNAALMLIGHRRDGQVSAVSVVTSDDTELRKQGQQTLKEAARIAAAANLEIHTQCRLSVNTVTGLSHSVKELEATDILIGLHRKRRISDNFYGRFAPDLVAATTQQILIYRELMPLNTLRRIHLVVPRNAEFEPGFRQWADRIANLSEQLAVTMDVYSGHDTLAALREVWKGRRHQVHADFINYSTFDDFQPIASSTRQDHMVVIVAARPGMPSHEQHYLAHLPEQLERYFSTRSLMIIYPSTLGTSDSRPRTLSIN